MFVSTLKNLLINFRDVEAEEEVVVVQKGRQGSTIQNKEPEEEEMVVLLNTQTNLQQPNGKISSA